MEIKSIIPNESNLTSDNLMEKTPVNTVTEGVHEGLLDKLRLFEAVFDQIPEAVIVIDIEGAILFYNQMTVSLLGRDPKHVRPENWSEYYGFFLDDEVTPFPSKSMPIVRALHGEPEPSEEMILITSSKPNPVWITCIAKPLSNSIGIITGIIIILRDITYRKTVELSRSKYARRAEALYSITKSIAESDQNLANILNTVAIHTSEFIGDACVITLLNQAKDKYIIGGVHHKNPKARAFLQQYKSGGEYPLGDGVVKGVIDSREPLLIPSISSEKMETISSPEYAKYIKDVGVHSVIVVPIQGREGVIGTLGLSRDRGGKAYTAEDQTFLLEIANRVGLSIEHANLVEALRNEVNERRVVKRALDESELLFRSIFESTNLGIKVLDQEGFVIRTNRAFSEILGFSEDELMGQPLTKILYEKDSNRWNVNFRRISRGEVNSSRFEHRLTHKDGSTVWVNASFTAFNIFEGWQKPDMIVAIMENITDRKKLELEMNEIKNRLQENLEKERLHLAQELHDGPMQELYTAIYQLEILKNQIDTHYQSAIEDTRQTIQKVIEELRATAQELRPPSITAFGLEKAIRSYIQEITEKYPGYKISLDLARDLQNLPESVRLTLFRIYQGSITNILRHAEATEISILFKFSNEEALLEISDNGKGFHVPRSWISLTRQGHFGLAGAAERVELLGGTFSIESTPGHGTTVRTLIPSQKPRNGNNHTQEGA